MTFDIILVPVQNMLIIVIYIVLNCNGIWYNAFWCQHLHTMQKHCLCIGCMLCVYCTRIYVWIWYLCWGTDRVDGCGINTAHYPVFGRWSPWVGLIYWSDDQSIPLIPLFLVLVYFQCAQYTSQMAKVCLSFPLPSLLPERLMEPGATKSRSPGAEQATQVCVYLIVTHTAEPFLQAATLISIG